MVLMLRVLLNVLVGLLHRLCCRVVPQRLLQLAQLVVPRGSLPLVAPHARLAQPLLHAQAAARRLHWLRRLLLLLGRLLLLVGVGVRVSVHIVVRVSVRVSVHIVMLLFPVRVVVLLLPVRVMLTVHIVHVVVMRVLLLPVRVVRLLVLPMLVVVLFLPVSVVNLGIRVVVLLLPVRIVGLLLVRVSHLRLLLLLLRRLLLLLHWLLLSLLLPALWLLLARLLRLAALLGGGIGGVEPHRAARQVSTQVGNLLQPELLLQGGQMTPGAGSPISAMQCQRHTPATAPRQSTCAAAARKRHLNASRNQQLLHPSQNKNTAACLLHPGVGLSLQLLLHVCELPEVLVSPPLHLVGPAGRHAREQAQQN
jgi:hypothetical protein